MIAEGITEIGNTSILREYQTLTNNGGASTQPNNLVYREISISDLAVNTKTIGLWGRAVPGKVGSVLLDTTNVTDGSGGMTQSMITVLASSSEHGSTQDAPQTANSQ